MLELCWVFSDVPYAESTIPMVMSKTTKSEDDFTPIINALIPNVYNYRIVIKSFPPIILCFNRNIALKSVTYAALFLLKSMVVAFPVLRSTIGSFALSGTKFSIF